MRKFLTLLAMIAISASVFAQKEVTKFMGIPVDGSPTEMIKKLKAKGFTTDEDAMQVVKQGLVDLSQQYSSPSRHNEQHG